MKIPALVAAMLVTIGVGGAPGQTAEVAQPTNTVVTNPVAATPISLTNRTKLVISKLRGVDPANVKLRWPSDRVTGPFEIGLENAIDCRKEAEELSKELGGEAVVIVDHVSADGLVRTNWSYRNGMARQVTAPVGTTGLGPSARRLYVWPQSQLRPATPAGVRVRTKADD